MQMNDNGMQEIEKFEAENAADITVGTPDEIKRAKTIRGGKIVILYEVIYKHIKGRTYEGIKESAKKRGVEPMTEADFEIRRQDNLEMLDIVLSQDNAAYWIENEHTEMGIEWFKAQVIEYMKWKYGKVNAKEQDFEEPKMETIKNAKVEEVVITRIDAMVKEVEVNTEKEKANEPENGKGLGAVS